MPGAAAEYLVLLVIAGGAGVLLLRTLVFGGVARRRKAGDEDLFAEPPRPPWWSGLVAMLLVVAAVALPIALLVWTSGTRSPVASPQVEVGPPGSGVEPTQLAPGGAGGSWAGWDWAPVAVVGGAAIALAALAVGLRRRRPATPTIARRRSEMAEAVLWTIEDIRRDPDPRHAVISAYVRMERELTAGGWPRRASRAPFEYLEEALRNLAVPAAPARALTELFEVARFGRRRVDSSMKDRAIDALLDVKRALETEVS